MTKPSLMTFSNIETINFYFNAKLTDFAIISYQFNIWLTYYTMYRGYETHSYLLVHIVASVLFEMGRVAAFKGLYNDLNNNS